MLKRIGTLLCVLALGMFLIGCGGGEKKPTPKEKGPDVKAPATPGGETPPSKETPPTPTTEKPDDKPEEKS